MKIFSFLIIFSCFLSFNLSAQESCSADSANQRDIVDVLEKIFKKDSAFIQRMMCGGKKARKLHTAVAPAVGYTLFTQLAAAIAANGAFYTDTAADQNLSVINTAPTITQRKQFILPIISNIWTPENKYNITGDWKFLKYPQQTYGLGGHTKPSDADTMDYSLITLREQISKRVAKDFFVGLGYAFDYHFNVKEKGVAVRETDFQKYNLATGSPGVKTISSGFLINLLYDSRRNPINPPHGGYVNIIYRPNFSFLGSDQNWQGLIIDARKYFPLDKNSRKVLGFWSYNNFTLSGNRPFLDLPSTAWDTYFNTGRGYIQSRFRGANLIYFESEFRFRILKNGLLGGVVFANAQSVSEWPSNKFETILPGWGTGLRIKMNKHSNTNIALDYGFGLNGSNGIFVNLGEVF